MSEENKKEIKRATGLLILEIVNSNPNGDPDRESDPRQRPNGFGEISPVSFKRKIRDLLEDESGPVFIEVSKKIGIKAEDCRILESRGRIRAEIIKEMGEDIKEFDQEKFNNSKIEINIGDLAKGIYIIRVNGSIVRRFIKE